MADITIPREARKAAWEAFVDASMNEKLSSEECVDATCLAMLRNWPGANWDEAHTIGIILPLAAGGQR